MILIRFIGNISFFCFVFITVPPISLKFILPTTCGCFVKTTTIFIEVKHVFATSFRASLGWFAHEPEWYDVKHVNFAQSEAQSVSIFLHYLSSERGNSLQSDAKIRGRENGISLIDSVR